MDKRGFRPGPGPLVIRPALLPVCTPPALWDPLIGGCRIPQRMLLAGLGQTDRRLGLTALVILTGLFAILFLRG